MLTLAVMAAELRPNPNYVYLLATMAAPHTPTYAHIRLTGTVTVTLTIMATVIVTVTETVTINTAETPTHY